MERKRLNYIDCGRLLCILFVCMAHSGSKILNPTGMAILLMPFFFFIFGFLCKPEKYSVCEFAASRFKQIVIPFFLIQPLCFALDLLRVKIFALDTSSSALAASYFLFPLYGSGVFPPFAFFKSFSLPQFGDTLSTVAVSVLNAPTWFLPVMFTASLLFYPLAKFLEKNFSMLKLSATVLCLFCLAGIEAQTLYAFQLPWGLGRAFLAAGIMLIGCYVRKKALLKTPDRKHSCIIYCTAAVSVLSAFLTGTTGEMSISDYMHEAGYCSLFILGLGGSTAACALLLFLKDMEEKYGETKLFSTLALAGRKTLWIYLLHMPFFFIFDVIFLKCGIQPNPCYYNHILYPYSAATLLPHIIQILITMLLCVLVGCAWEKFKNRHRNIRTGITNNYTGEITDEH
ncbi:MAG: acyltransferase family protein [Synergistaceae bacterium]|nr:acyltransferase family protein [Candidatus Equadaptatus faecalis]